jgi:hypothetical protein
MLAFEVLIDNQRMCVAGMDDWSVMSVIVSAVRERDGDTPRPGELDVTVGGLSEEDSNGVSHHARWGRVKLAIGSQVTINIVDNDQTDPPIKRYRSDREVQEDPFTEEEIEEMERADWLRLKAKFEPDSGSQA